jgi:hypothetical protein
MKFQYGDMWSAYVGASDLFLACGHSEVLRNNRLSCSTGLLSQAVEKLQGIDLLIGRYIGPKPKRYHLIRTRQWEKGRKFGLFQVGIHDGEVDTDVLYGSVNILGDFARQNPDLRIDIESPTVYGLALDKARNILDRLPDNVRVWIPKEVPTAEETGIEELRPQRRSKTERMERKRRRDLFDTVSDRYSTCRSEEEARCFSRSAIVKAIPSRLFAENIEANMRNSLHVFEVFVVRGEEVLYQIFLPAMMQRMPAEITGLIQPDDYLVSFELPGVFHVGRQEEQFACTIEVLEDGDYRPGEVPPDGDAMPRTEEPWDTAPWEDDDTPTVPSDEDIVDEDIEDVDAGDMPVTAAPKRKRGKKVQAERETA